MERKDPHLDSYWVKVGVSKIRCNRKYLFASESIDGKGLSHLDNASISSQYLEDNKGVSIYNSGLKVLAGINVSMVTERVLESSVLEPNLVFGVVLY